MAESKKSKRAKGSLLAKSGRPAKAGKRQLPKDRSNERQTEYQRKRAKRLVSLGFTRANIREMGMNRRTEAPLVPV